MKMSERECRNCLLDEKRKPQTLMNYTTTAFDGTVIATTVLRHLIGY
jgi:hypothetical protein